MIAFNPDLIEVRTTDAARGEWQMSVPAQGGTAYIRITPQLRDFFKLCHEKHGVIGFEYDFDNPGLNLGVVLKKEDENGPA